MADLTGGPSGAGRELPEGDDVIGQAVRGELADKLSLAPQALGDLSPEAAARTLEHLNEINRRLHTLEGPNVEPNGNGAAAQERRDVVARALRDELADKLHIHPRLLGGLRVEAAAATLAKVNQSRKHLQVLESGGHLEGVRGAVPTERRDVVGRVIRDELGRELGVHPRDLVELSPHLAATTLSHLTQIHRKLRRLESEASGEEVKPAALAAPDRRDIVGRTIRDELSERLHLHPALLGALPPRAAASMLTHLQALDRRLRDLEQRIAVDELTGALRRAAGQDALDREIERARRSDGRLVLAFIDVDHLKAVNDAEGHAAGDDLLRTAALTLRSRLRRYDVVIRWGGDEFVCILPQTDVEGARRIFDEIETAYRSRTDDNTFSAGFSALRERDTADQLIDRADAELYARKRQRREEEQSARPPEPQPPAAGNNGEQAQELALDRDDAITEEEVPAAAVAPAAGPAAGEEPAASESERKPPLWKRWTAIG